MRADAQQNHERLLEMAAKAFARDGTGASLKAIAEAAGVGIGTLYRRFPTRETLVEAVYRNEVTNLCAAAQTLLAELSPVDAVQAWSERFVDFMTAKRGMAAALRVVLTSPDDLMRTRFLLRDAIAMLLNAGAADGSIRAGLDPYDVLMGLGGITLIAEEQRDLALRLVDLLINGVIAGATLSDN
ncbi:TetR/AcrR family transcriptional regulator [Fodinicola feengrottensis]|uniref:TetR/AcrR family transcriptional regulator n=1 Tax=Fodinicola feengrottensis TaxID=435914 RepID=A0ABN2FT66_9ACTN|nr:helix-turn-helix domain containing protein [Fodinicola feengrottensis]